MPIHPSPRAPFLTFARVLFTTLATASLAALAVPTAHGLPLKKPADPKPFPASAPREARWVVRLPSKPSANLDHALSANPQDMRVELIVGQGVLVDCNRHVFNGTIEKESIQGWGYPLYRVTAVGPMASTRKACPPINASAACLWP